MTDWLWKSPIGGFNNPYEVSREKGFGDGGGSAYRVL